MRIWLTNFISEKGQDLTPWLNFELFEIFNPFKHLAWSCTNRRAEALIQISSSLDLKLKKK